MYRRILVPLDGSDTAERGLQEAVKLAEAFDSNLILLSVVEYYPMMMEMSTTSTWEQVTTDLRESGQRVLDKAHAIVKAAGVASLTLLKDASATRVCDVIVDQAREHECDLIVMGTHGRRGIAHAVIGSDAERVIRLAPCAVLLVRKAQ